MKVTSLLYRYATKKIMIPLFIIGLVMFFAMSTNLFGFLNESGFNSFKMLDVNFFYSAEQFETTISSFSTEMIQAYMILHIIDYIFIFSFYPALALLLLYTAKKPTILVAVVGLAMLFDFTENILIDIGLNHDIPNILQSVSGFLTMFKFIMLILSIAVVISNVIKHKGVSNVEKTSVS